MFFLTNETKTNRNIEKECANVEIQVQRI